MSDLPIRRLTVSDFRKIGGTRDLPFDAPIVLIHGPNGTGKTSVLSALEMALTGEIRSMARQSARYLAHLPHYGQPYATMVAEVAESLRSGPGMPLTVGGARVEGLPALGATEAKFYSERCYLDQSSLSRLLDLYQERDGVEGSALEQFVNELLGLEKLDALRLGLAAAHDLRLLKGLAPGVGHADREAKAAAEALRTASGLRAELHLELEETRARLAETLRSLGCSLSESPSDASLLESVQVVLMRSDGPTSSALAVDTQRELLALGGRIEAQSERPSAQRLQETRDSLGAAERERDEWLATSRQEIEAWDSACEALGLSRDQDSRPALDDALERVAAELHAHTRAENEATSLRPTIRSKREKLDELQIRLLEANEVSSALVEGLASLRNAIGSSSTCPVCDRDFLETGDGDLGAHIDTKLAELTSHGQELIAIRKSRDDTAAMVSRMERELTRLEETLLSLTQRKMLDERRDRISALVAGSERVERLRQTGAALDRRYSLHRRTLEELEVASREKTHIDSELQRHARALDIDLPDEIDTVDVAFPLLIAAADQRLAQHASSVAKYESIRIAGARLRSALERGADLTQRLADAAHEKGIWDDRVSESRRRQKVAREVHEASNVARTKIVNRVFTESLNDVWRAVFTRLAPSESFIPRFGIPTATKKSFEIQLETTRRDGEVSGPPQMMLSAGNLNTAALSLFIALHLAVEPVLPCLVFDDPVQAMDEVHVAQFAALMRMLAKQNGRQIVIAVHERELFDYLALELSPAYEGDQLITIELGDRVSDEDEGVTRHLWSPDAAIAV